MAVAAAHAVEHVGLPECTYALAQAAIYLVAGAEVERGGHGARRRARRTSASTARSSRRPRCAPPPTRRARALGRGVGYDYPHDHPGHVNDQEHLPEGREHLRFYEPGDAEPELARAADATIRRCPRPRSRERRGRGGARPAQPLWALVPVAARARYLRRAAVAMLDELDDLALRLADGDGLAARAAAGCPSCCRRRAGCARWPTTGRARWPTSG